MPHDADDDARPRDAQQKERHSKQSAAQYAASPDLYTNATPAHLYRYTVSTATPTSDADAASPASGIVDASDGSPAPTLSGPPSGGEIIDLVDSVWIGSAFASEKRVDFNCM